MIRHHEVMVREEHRTKWDDGSGPGKTKQWSPRLSFWYNQLHKASGNETLKSAVSETSIVLMNWLSINPNTQHKNK